MNSISIAGRVGNLKFYPPKHEGSKLMVVIGIADKFWDGKERQTQWWNCKVYGKRAEWAQKYLKKGQMVAVVGRVAPDNYTRPDGTKLTSTQVFIDQLEFSLPPKGPAQHAPEVSTHKSDDSWQDSADDDDLPF